MKVVNRKSDGKIVYRSLPDFIAGMGVENAVLIWGGVDTDYEEAEITDEEWDVAILAGNAETR